MHREILTKNQIQLLPLLKNFSKDYILTGGTAIALHLGHRRSINGKLFKEQLSYFEDIDYEEEFIYLDKPIRKEEIQQFLIKTATEAF